MALILSSYNILYVESKSLAALTIRFVLGVGKACLIAGLLILNGCLITCLYDGKIQFLRFRVPSW